MHIEPDETPRQFGEDDELPDDFGSRVGDTLTFGGSGSYIRTIGADEARRLAPGKLTDGRDGADQDPWPATHRRYSRGAATTGGYGTCCTCRP